VTVAAAQSNSETIAQRRASNSIVSSPPVSPAAAISRLMRTATYTPSRTSAILK
jgi:hypothetical protein